MNKSSCLVHRIDSMSLERRRGCCRACIRGLAWPLCVSHIEASQEKGAPSNSIRGAQVRWGRRTSASSPLFTDVPLLSLGSLAIFCYLLPFRGVTLHSSSSWSVLIFFKFGMAYRLRSVGGGGGGRTTGGCVLGAFFKVPPLFLLAIRPFKPGLFFRSIASSSFSDSKFIRAMTNCFGWMEESLTDSVSESEISTSFLDAPSSSMKQNRSISSSRDSREDAISSYAAIIASRGTCCNGITNGGGIWWMGNLTGGRLSRAKKSGLDTSIRFIQGSLALMAWPISWKVFEIGSKSKIKWTARNCRSSLMKIFDRSM